MAPRHRLFEQVYSHRCTKPFSLLYCLLVYKYMSMSAVHDAVFFSVPVISYYNLLLALACLLVDNA